MTNFLSYIEDLKTIPFWSDYASAALLFVIFLVILKIFQSIILARLGQLAKKTTTDIDDTLIAVVKTLKPPFYIFLSFYLAVLSLNLPPLFLGILNALLIIYATYQVIKALEIVTNYTVRRLSDSESEPGAKTALQSLNILIKITLWIIGALLILSNLGINITSLIAGLGIGGIAVALALQNILSDLFSSFAIYFDRPFQVGDFIVVGKEQGTVERIGIKTTRLRALQGEEIVISNRELTGVRVQNFKRMRERRVSFDLGVVYDTSPEITTAIPGLIKSAVTEVEGVRFDRAHFKSFGDSALIFEIVYFISSGLYTEYMDKQQSINLKIQALFRENKIDFAYPTQTIFLSKNK